MLMTDNAAMARLAGTDQLTGIPNRVTFQEALRREYKAVARQQAPLSVVYIDADHFKRINDVHGHLAGDTVLRETAQRIASVVRAPALVARIGGEEFAILAPRTDAEEAFMLAHRVLEAVRTDPIGIPEQFLNVTVSVGVAVMQPDSSISVDALLKMADDALYVSKAEGRDRVTLHISAPDAVVAA
jgi:diguanylate cyclase (GGDEF)-like protein